MTNNPRPNSPETGYDVEEHYRIEKDLAQQLRAANRDERLHLYQDLYEELFRRVPYHPQLTRKASVIDRQRQVARHLRQLEPFLNKDITFLEIGPGDCALSFAVAPRVRQVYAVDVSSTITDYDAAPRNFKLLLSNGLDMPVAPESIHVAYSNQLMEHLHPDDALEQLQNIYRVLARNGNYICITPNRLVGPCDVSKFFDRVATGFHLKEYTIGELAQLFRRVGFREVRNDFGGKGHYVLCRTEPFVLSERILDILPYQPRRWLAKHVFPSIRLVGTK